jgi:hypothetical protein
VSDVQLMIVIIRIVIIIAVAAAHFIKINEWAEGMEARKEWKIYVRMKF